MTAIDTARLRELLAKATPGPWHATYDDAVKVRDVNGDAILMMQHVHLRGRRNGNEVNATAELIAALRNAAPALLDAHDRADRCAGGGVRPHHRMGHRAQDDDTIPDDLVAAVRAAREPSK